MSEKNNSSFKTDTIKRLCESFIKQAKEMNLPLDVAIVNLDKDDPSPLSGNFNLKTGSISELKKSIEEAKINKQDVAIGIDGSETRETTKRPKFR